MALTTNSSPWNESDKIKWLAQQQIKRSYESDVVKKIQRLGKSWALNKYGALSIDVDKYPLFLAKSSSWSIHKKTVLITGGVHGYETSGIHGAIRFLETINAEYLDSFNFILLPCISPWGYETINRWNSHAIDPNRSFRKNSLAEESLLAMKAVWEITNDIFAHFDLHETTDTDNTIFRPALASRDAKPQDEWNIPDGFYLVGDSSKPNPGFQRAIIDSVEKQTHIAPADENGRIIGELIEQKGVINYDTKGLGLCSGFSDCEFGTTTEVYPNSDGVTDEECIRAQVAAINGGLSYLMALQQLA